MTDTMDLINTSPALAEFKRGDAALMTLAEKHSGLKINGINDREGYKRVHAARMELRAARISIEKDRKGLKEGALAFGKVALPSLLWSG